MQITVPLSSAQSTKSPNKRPAPSDSPVDSHKDPSPQALDTDMSNAENHQDQDPDNPDAATPLLDPDPGTVLNWPNASASVTHTPLNTFSTTHSHISITLFAPELHPPTKLAVLRVYNNLTIPKPPIMETV
jgi:hypothetical protein